MYKGPQRDRSLEKKFSSSNHLGITLCWIALAAALITIILPLLGFLI